MIIFNGEPLKATFFPDKTSQVWKINELLLKDPSALIEWRFEDEGEFMRIAQLKDLLDSLSIACFLHIPFLPYARQDKPISNKTTFALSTFCKLINFLKFAHVSCVDPHSEIVGNLLDNSSAVYPNKEAKSAFVSCGANLVCYPDSGALKKYRNKYSDLDYIHAIKNRDQKTGRILSMELVGNPRNASVLIIDDICDGGATFVSLASLLRKNGATDVNLFVSHGIFSKGTDVLKQSGISRIFTKEGEVI